MARIDELISNLSTLSLEDVTVLKGYEKWSEEEKKSVLDALIEATGKLVGKSGAKGTAIPKLTATFMDNFRLIYGNDASDYAAVMGNYPGASTEVPDVFADQASADSIAAATSAIKKEVKSGKISDINALIDQMIGNYKSALSISNRYASINNKLFVNSAKEARYIERQITTIETEIEYLRTKFGIDMIALNPQVGKVVSGFKGFRKQDGTFDIRRISIMGSQETIKFKQTLKVVREEIKRQRTIVEQQQSRDEVVETIPEDPRKKPEVPIIQPSQPAQQPVIAQPIPNMGNVQNGQINLNNSNNATININYGITPVPAPKQTPDISREEYARQVAEREQRLYIARSQADTIIKNWDTVSAIDNDDIKRDLGYINPGFIDQVKEARRTGNDDVLLGLALVSHESAADSKVKSKTLLGYAAGVVGNAISYTAPVVETPVVSEKPAPVVPHYEPTLDREELYRYIKAFCDTYIDMQRARAGAVPTVAQPEPSTATHVASAPVAATTTEVPVTTTTEVPATDTVEINPTDDLGAISGESGDEPIIELEVIEDDSTPNEGLSTDVVEGISGDAEELISATKPEETPEIEEEVPVEDVTPEQATSAYAEPSKAAKPERFKGIKAVGSWLARHPWRTTTVLVASAALATTAVAFANPALAALVPKLAVYGLGIGTVGAFTVSGITTGIARAASKRYNRFCHNYDFERRQRKLDRKVRRRELTISRIEDQLSEIAAVEGVVIPDYARVATSNASLNRQFDKNAAKIAKLQEMLNSEVSMDLAGMSPQSRKKIRKYVRQLNRLDHKIVRVGRRAGSKIAKVENLDAYMGQHIEEDRTRRRGLNESIRASVQATAETRRASGIASVSRRDAKRARSVTSDAKIVMGRQADVVRRMGIAAESEATRAAQLQERERVARETTAASQSAIERLNGLRTGVIQEFIERHPDYRVKSRGRLGMDRKGGLADSVRYTVQTETGRRDLTIDEMAEFASTETARLQAAETARIQREKAEQDAKRQRDLVEAQRRRRLERLEKNLLETTRIQAEGILAEMIDSIVKNAKGTIDVNFVGIRESLTNALKGQASDEMIKDIVSEIASNSKIAALVSAAQKKKPTASDAKEAMLETIKKLLSQYLGEIRTGVHDDIVAEGTVGELVANFGKILESNGMRAEIAEKTSGIVEAIEKVYNTAKERIAASANTKEPAPTTESAVDRFSFENAYKTTREAFDKLKVKTKEKFETLFSVRIQEFEEMSKTKLTAPQKQELLKRAMAQYERDYPSTSM